MWCQYIWMGAIGVYLDDNRKDRQWGQDEEGRGEGYRQVGDDQ